MGFLDLFRPKWKHSDAEVRLEAVRQLSGEDAALLAQVARQDRDPRVRKIALKKIADPQVLFDLAEHDPDEGLRRDAAEKAADLLLATAVGDGNERTATAALEKMTVQRAIAEVARRAAHEPVRQAALARLSDPKAIAEVARKSDDPHVRRQAVERITDVTVLREVAINDNVKEVALAAIARIDDGPALDQIAKKSKTKAVKGAAKDKLKAKREAEHPEDPSGLTEAKRKARLALLARAAEEAAASDDWKHAEAAIEHSKAGLAELGIRKGEETFQKRVDRAILKFQARHSEFVAVERAQAARNEKRAREAVVEAERASETNEATQERAAEDAKLREIAEASRKEEDERRNAERARRAEEKAKRDAEKAARDADKAAERAKKDAEADENLRRLEEVCARLESLIGSAERKALESALKSAHEVFGASANLPREKGGAARDRYQAARGKLVIQLQELKDADDWKRWSNVPRLEALCVKMEALLQKEDLKETAAELKALQAEWKSVGAAPKDKSETLWKRFKATSDQVYERCKVHFAAQDEARALHLKKKEELCVRVETLAATPDPEMNWKETAETIKALQEEWKGTGHVPKAEGEAAWNRFRAACDQFFERRKVRFGQLDEERAGNLKKQEELCARAEALAAISDDKVNWKDTADQLKELQAEWKTIGPAPKDQADAVWNRFRGACDGFFERRTKHFGKLDEERAGNLKKKELLCEKVEALAAADDHELAMAEVRKLQAEWKTVGPAPKDQSDAVWERFRSACDRIYDRNRAPEPPAPAQPPEPGAQLNGSKFENKLPLSGIAEKLAAATSEWEDLAGAAEDDKNKK